MVAQTLPPLAGVITDAAKETNRRLKVLKLPASSSSVLRQLADLTFANAGFHRQWGHDLPGSWCHFDFAAWHADLGMSKATLHNALVRLVEDRIIWLEYDETPGRGRIGWNLAYDEWQPRDSWGGKRANAGRKSSARTNLKEVPLPSSLPHESIKLVRPVADMLIKLERMPAQNAIKLEHSAAVALDVKTAGAPSRIGTEEEITEEEDVAPVGAARVKEAAAFSLSDSPSAPDASPPSKREENADAPGARLQEATDDDAPLPASAPAAEDWDALRDHARKLHTQMQLAHGEEKDELRHEWQKAMYRYNSRPAAPAPPRPAPPTPEPEPDPLPPAALFPEALPPPSVYDVLGPLFFDWEHVSNEDKQAVAIVAQRIEKRGFKAEDIPARFYAWSAKFRDLKRKTIFHFEKKIAAVGVC